MAKHKRPKLPNMYSHAHHLLRLQDLSLWETQDFFFYRDLRRSPAKLTKLVDEIRRRREVEEILNGTLWRALIV